MSEYEYFAGEPEDFEGDDILGQYLIDDSDDLTLVLLPKIDFDLDEVIESYYKLLKMCKDKDQLKHILYQFYSHINGVVTLRNDIQYLQDRAKEIEFNIEILKQEYDEL